MKKMTAVVFIGALGLGLAYLWIEAGESLCQICRRPLHSATIYQIQLSADETVEVCCPRCGLHYQNAHSEVKGSQVADFESGSLFPAEDAIYVVGSDIHLCCSSERVREDRAGGQYLLSWDRCLPSVVAFKNKARANLFRMENGGYLSTYSQLVEQESASLTPNP